MLGRALAGLVGAGRLAKRVPQRPKSGGWQGPLAAAHLLSAVALLLAYVAVSTSRRVNPFVYLVFSETYGAGADGGLRAARPSVCGQPCTWRLDLGALLVALAFATALSHALQASLRWEPAGGDGAEALLWDRLMAANANPARWLECALTYPLMAVVFARLCGLVLATELALAAAAALGTAFCGLAAELVLAPCVRDGRPVYETRAPALLMQAAGWALFAATLVPALVRFASAGAPAWVHAVVIAEALFFASFGVLALVQLCVGPASYAAVSQRGYDALSLVAKLYLQWTLFGGAVGAG